MFLIVCEGTETEPIYFEAFELWYLLHFDFHQTAISRKSYAERLSKRLGFAYKKNDPRMYDLLESETDTAIKHAQKLIELYGERHNPGRDNPCTSVHLLVEQLHQQTV